MNLIPYVIEKTGRGERTYDIWSRLLKDRIVFLGGPVTADSANVINAQLLFLANDDAEADIHFYINSPGGSVTDGLAVYDTMQFINCDVCTYCLGMAASMGSVLLAGGTKGKRYVLPNSRVLIHQPHIGGIQGTATDLNIQAEEMLRLRESLYKLLAADSGQTMEQIEADCDRDKWLTADAAIEYGLVDQILEKAPDLKKSDDD